MAAKCSNAATKSVHVTHFETTSIAAKMAKAIISNCNMYSHDNIIIPCEADRYPQLERQILHIISRHGSHISIYWGRVTHICVGNLTLIGSDNGLSPGRRQAIIKTNIEILLIGTLETNFSEILSEIHTFSFKKMHLRMSSAKRRPFCLGLNVLNKCRTRVSSYSHNSCMT